MRAYQRKLLRPEDAPGLLQGRQTVVTAMAAAEPFTFYQGLADRARELTGLKVFGANPSREWPCFQDPALAGRLELVVLFFTGPVRRVQTGAVVTYLPAHLSRWARTILAAGPVDVFWGSCSPPDRHGFVNLGPSACYESEVARQARCVVLEVNPQIPATYGCTSLPASEVDHFIEVDHPLPAAEAAPVGDEERLIGAHVAGLIENGSTIQLGIGAIPNAVGEALRGHRDLGVHTELITESMMDLYERGVITGASKSLWPGKMVGAFVLGTDRLYRFVDRNPAIEMQPASVTNDRWLLGRNHRMVSVNSAVEIDVTGQVCSESVGHREVSGVGGAADTHVGAQRSEGGRGIIAVRSLGPGGRSKLVFELTPGAKVSISRNDVDTVITEYGIAHLAGRSVSERVRALIGIAHPTVRADLEAAAKRERYL